jgi:exonuclease VII large subunit
MLAAYSVSEITKYVKALVESDDFLAGVWVRGEISNFTLHSSGHMYFSLKDEASSAPMCKGGRLQETDECDGLW